MGDAQIRVNFSQSDVDRIQGKLAAISALKSPQIVGAFRRGLLAIEDKLKQNTSGPILKVRSGRLRNSIGSFTFGRDKELVGRVGSGVRTGEPVKYASILERGGVITAKNGKMLAIPIGAALTPAGVERFRPNDIRGRSFIMRKNGRAIIFLKQGKRALPVFVLKRSVKIPAFHYLSRSLAQSQSQALADIESGIDAILEGK